MKMDFDNGKLFVARMVGCDWRTIICVCGPGLNVLLLFPFLLLEVQSPDITLAGLELQHSRDPSDSFPKSFNFRCGPTYLVWVGP